MPLVQLLDLIAIQQIKEEGAQYKMTDAEEYDDFRRVLSM